MNMLSGKTALVTGASRGIGAAICAAYLAEGARVVGTATGDAGVARINNAGGEGLLYDAADKKQTSALAAKINVDYGGVDIAVINAAVNADGLLLRMKDEDWERVLEVNLSAAFRLTRELMRAMLKKRYGRIIFLSSVVASIGNAGQANYCAAKAGVEGYCRALARETATRNVTANAIAPGFIETDMTAKLPPAARESFLQIIPAKRAGKAEEVAAAAVFLASDAASYITGQTLHVNGGLYMG